MAQLKKVVEPFGEVNIYPQQFRQTRVVATILMEPVREGTQTGIALDGSGSMSQLYGVNAGGPISPIFRKPAENLITPVAQKVCSYLARKLDADGGTTCIYWATGQAGGRIEEIGDLTADQAEKHIFGPPKNFGTGTQLLPAVHYFTERFNTAPWGFYVFITDGELHDLEDVKSYSVQLAREISAGRRRPIKFVLIGIGSQVNERQMEELDDLQTGTNVDIWDHKLAAELTSLQQIFAEVIDENARIADRGRILAPDGRTIRDYSDTGVPAKLEFEVPPGMPYFTLEVNGNRIHQSLSDTTAAPPSELTTQFSTTAAKPKSDSLDDVTEVEEVVEVLPVEDEVKKPDEKKSEEWLGFDLEFEKKQPDVDLNKGQ